MQKNIAGQKWCVFAFNLTNNTFLSGDAANITANLRIDGGAANAIDDVNPTELEDGFYAFDITQAETSGDMILISPQSSTSDIQVIGVPGVIYTTAPNINKLGIETRIWIRNLTLTQSGYYGISTDLFINKKEGVIRFYKEIGFSLSRKQNKLENYLKEVNWIDGFETVQHINSEKRIVQTN